MDKNTDSKSFGDILSQQQADKDKNSSGILEQTEHFNDTLNIIKSSIDDTYYLGVEQLDKLTNIEKFSKLLSDHLIGSAENKMEDDVVKQATLSLLQQLVDNTMPKPEKKDKPNLIEFGLGDFMTGLAVALGALAGIVGSTINSMKFFLKGIQFLMKTFTPNLYEKLAKGISNVVNFFSDIGQSLKTIFKNGFNILKDGFDSLIGGALEKLKSMFSFGEESTIGKIIKGFKTAITMFFEPFKDAFIAIQELSSGPVGRIFASIQDVVSGVIGSISKFGAIFKKVAGFVSKIALPLQIIMGIWDTISGAIEGYETGGILGAIKGAIKGLFNSVVGGVADLLKDMVSWVADKLGFKGVSEFLDSFSFTDLFSTLVDNIGNAIEYVLGAIFVPGRFADIAKDAISWISKNLGFENFSAALDSFSFENIFSEIQDSISNTFSVIGDWFSEVTGDFMSLLQGIGIPEFSIPVPEWMGGPITLGPWYPFKSESIPEKTPTKEQVEPTKEQVEPTKEQVEPTKEQTGKPEITPTKEQVEPTKEQTGKPEITKPWWAFSFGDEEPITPTTDATGIEPPPRKSGVDYIMPMERQTANVVYNKSGENEDKKEDMTKAGGGNTMISAPTVNTSNKTVNSQTVKLPSRNPDSTSSRYIASRNSV